MQRIKFLGCSVALAAVFYGLATLAAPMQAKTRKPADQVLSLAKLQKIEVVIDRLAKPILDSGASDKLIRDAWMEQLTAARYEVAEGKNYPRLVLRNSTAIDAAVPGGVAYVLALSLEQNARIDRLDETLSVPTFVITIVGQETPANLRQSVLSSADRMLTNFLNAVDTANLAKQK